MSPFLVPADESKLSSERSCIFDREGRLLWRSPAWVKDPNTANDPRILGVGWQEFIPPRDLLQIMGWFADPAECSIVFCAMIPATGELMRVAWSKVPYGDHWLVLGTVGASVQPAPVPFAVSARPGPSCLPSSSCWVVVCISGLDTLSFLAQMG